MIMTYNQCIEKYGSDYMMKKEIEEGILFQKEKGKGLGQTALQRGHTNGNKRMKTCSAS